MKSWHISLLFAAALAVALNALFAAGIIGIAQRPWEEWLSIVLAQIIGAMQVALYFTLRGKK